MEDLEEITYKQYECITNSLLGEIRQSNKDNQNTIKSLVMALVISLALLTITNLIWLNEFTKYDYVTYSLDSVDGGNANFIGEDGIILNGESDCKKSN